MSEEKPIILKLYRGRVVAHENDLSELDKRDIITSYMDGGSRLNIERYPLFYSNKSQDEWITQPPKEQV